MIYAILVDVLFKQFQVAFKFSEAERPPRAKLQGIKRPQLDRRRNPFITDLRRPDGAVLAALTDRLTG